VVEYVPALLRARAMKEKVLPSSPEKGTALETVQFVHGGAETVAALNQARFPFAWLKFRLDAGSA
jgi:hypothetical protein